MKTYDPLKYDIVFAGINLNKGVADGTFIQVSSLGPGFTRKASVDGPATRSRQHDRGYQVRLTLMQTSEVNQRLSAIYKADRDGDANGQGVGTFRLADRAGETALECAKAYITDDPDIELAADASTREWMITCEDTDVTHGGNPDD